MNTGSRTPNDNLEEEKVTRESKPDFKEPGGEHKTHATTANTTNPVACVLAPAMSFTADRVNAAKVGKVPKKLPMRFAAPRATSSLSVGVGLARGSIENK